MAKKQKKEATQPTEMFAQQDTTSTGPNTCAVQATPKKLNNTKLTYKQDLYCLYCANPYESDADAYRKSHDTSKMSAQSIHQAVNELNNNPKITLRKEHYRAILKKEIKLSADDVIQNISEAAILPIYDKDGKVVISPAFLSCRNKANEILAKHFNLIDGDDNKPLSGTFIVQWGAQPEQQIQKIVADPKGNEQGGAE